MSPRTLQPLIIFLCTVALVSIVFAGCGSATLGEYEKEVTALNELAAEKLAEVSEALPGGAHDEDGAHEDEESHEDEGLSEGDESHETEGSTEEDESHGDVLSHEDNTSHEDEGETVEALVVALEEAIESLKTVILELEEVKVPGGMEDFHHSLLAFYQGNLSTYEALLTTLEPGEAHEVEGVSNSGEETEEHEEDSEESHDEDTSHDEEASGGGH